MVFVHRPSFGWQVHRRIPPLLAREPDLVDDATCQERVPELRREGVTIPEIGRWQLHCLGRDRRERLLPEGRRRGEPLRKRMGPAYGERRLDTAGETIGLNLLGRGDDHEIHQIPDPRVILAKGEV